MSLLIACSMEDPFRCFLLIYSVFQRVALIRSVLQQSEAFPSVPLRFLSIASYSERKRANTFAYRPPATAINRYSLLFFAVRRRPSRWTSAARRFTCKSSDIDTPFRFAFFTCSSHPPRRILRLSRTIHFHHRQSSRADIRIRQTIWFICSHQISLWRYVGFKRMFLSHSS